MARLRYNGLSTTLGGSLTNVATSVTFAAALTHSNGTNVPTITAGDYIPLAILGATGHLSEIVYLTAYTAGATTGTITRGQEGTAGAAHSNGDALTQAPLAADLVDERRLAFSPGSASYETFSRYDILFTSVASTAPSGKLNVFPIFIPAGFSVGNITVLSGNQAAVTPTHWWFALYDSSRVQLATTADQTTTAWAAFTAKTLPVATIASGAASSFTTTYSGLYFLSTMVAAATLPNFAGQAIQSTASGIAPILYAGSPAVSGLTTPTAFPNTLTAPGTGGNIPYAYVSN